MKQRIREEQVEQNIDEDKEVSKGSIMIPTLIQRNNFQIIKR